CITACKMYLPRSLKVAVVPSLPAKCTPGVPPAIFSTTGCSFSKRTVPGPLSSGYENYRSCFLAPFGYRNIPSPGGGNNFPKEAFYCLKRCVVKKKGLL